MVWTMRLWKRLHATGRSSCLVGVCKYRFRVLDALGEAIVGEKGKGRFI
jgi:hypothetical protein